MNNQKPLNMLLQTTYERTETIRKEMCLEPSVNFVLEPSELESIWCSGGTIAINNLFRRAAVHAKRVIILSHIIPTVELSDETKFDRYCELLDLPDWLTQSEILKQDISDENYCANGIYCFLPYYNPIAKVGFDKEMYWEDEAANLSLLLSDNYLRHQMTEGYATENKELSVFRFLLPSVSNVPLETLLSLRNDNKDHFDRLNLAEHKLLKGLFEVSSTTAAKTILTEVDSYIRSYKDRLQDIKRKHTKALSLMSLGMVAMTIPILLPVELCKVLAGVIGGFSFKDFIVEQFSILEQKNRIKSDDMYFAALVHNESMKFKH